MSFGKDLLRKIKNAGLAGANAHGIFSPPSRPIFTYDQVLEKNPKFAAVNIVLYLKDNEWHFPLIVRSTNERDRHSGQISLPGGKREELDKDFAQTAIRETSEEIGIEKHYVRIIRELSPIYIPPSNFYVYPFISYTKKNPEFILQQSEAVEVIEFPITSFLNLPDSPEIMALPGAGGHEVPVINFNGYIIWGATAMILSEFSQLIKKM
ncbi:MULTISPECIES: NUDIX hydrolase [Chryseobacterium]|uniref:NUDIX domain-containing protein n=1 Tax=Chryseobacterium scophthalmum TaxID=59733 RepID=A0A1N6G248_9FLAO|nr:MULTISPECIES: CoA pyrophosphatase [Chryseobacterium]MBM7421472.1 8-oxo-dGTP pyrophosphatase MutT (NUDIX family) [Chryseobacterium sp. JUb44]MDH6211435.1 8-oxo-dGTP pyrophosphatase MutT (NUDIX family) [Chryseobacterium sp. BIGb0186]WSO10086.1 CoA pyrophosphatase [Chryseobacterium scophthalmum]SIO01583.1 NUDIX domain-containing protein [Chryseobacterium scophthalmum]VXB58256.1 NUDIX domain-containing protein [Chryseobacterium sp. 8AT]